MITQSDISRALRAIADSIDEGNCHISEDRIMDIYRCVTDTYIDRTEAAKIMGISVSYFDKLRQLDKVPKPIKKRGEKPMWSRNEILDCQKSTPTHH